VLVGYSIHDTFRDDWGNVVGIINGVEPGPTLMYNSHQDQVDPGALSARDGYEPYGACIDVVEADNQDRTGTERVEMIHGRGAAATASRSTLTHPATPTGEIE